LESLGARLKREREQRKITLDEISLSTKIGTRFLLAIEEEHFDQLPGGIFNKGFVKAYARSVGVDEAEAVAEYELASGVGLPPESQPGVTPVLPVPAGSPMSIPSDDSGDPGSRIPWGWFAIALLILAFGFALWGFHARERSAKPSVILPPAANPAANEDRDNSAAPAAVSQTAPEVANAPPQPPASEPAADASQSSTPPIAKQDPSPSPGAFLVQIKAREDSWVAISADGREIMQDTLPASTEKSIGARDQIVIKTGNAGALDISFNGKKLPAQGAHNQVKTLTFDPSGLKL
jgi:cytoskeleton protein RodZ